MRERKGKEKTAHVSKYGNKKKTIDSTNIRSEPKKTDDASDKRSRGIWANKSKIAGALTTPTRPPSLLRRFSPYFVSYDREASIVRFKVKRGKNCANQTTHKPLRQRRVRDPLPFLTKMNDIKTRIRNTLGASRHLTNSHQRELCFSGAPFFSFFSFNL